MIKKKLQYQEDNKSSLNDISIKHICKNNINDTFNIKENTIYGSNSKKENERINIKQVRGRQLYSGNSCNISKINNSSLATTCESKKRIENKCNFRIIFFHVKIRLVFLNLSTKFSINLNLS